MKSICKIAINEYKMMVREKVYWFVLLVVIILAVADNIPIDRNLERLPFTVVPGYTVSRLLIQMGVILSYFLVFLFANRIISDKETSMIALFKIYNISKKEYICGKSLGGLIYFYLVFFVYLLVDGILFYIVNPAIFSVKVYVIGFCCSVIPVGFWVVNISMVLPAYIGKRITYIVMTLYFVLNVILVPDSNNLPPYFLFYGELIKNVYKYGLSSINEKAMIYNALFLFGGGIIGIILAIYNKGMWELYEEI